eukprot:m.287664 g.287664  ORF g.287664 m.287664 type:complete len:103 (+) comp17790_c0_seq5:198-506(+)
MAAQTNTALQNVVELTQTPFVKQIFTQLRSQKSDGPAFVQSANSIARLVLAEAINQLPYEDDEVITPTDETYAGKKLQRKVCGVRYAISIARKRSEFQGHAR